MEEKKRYRVTLPIEVDGVTYQFNDFVELDMETALLYKHALIAVEEVTHGGHS